MSSTPAGKPRRGLAIASLVLGILGLPTAGLLGIGALVAIVLGVLALVKASNAPQEYGGKGMAIAGIALAVLSFVMIPVLGIVAAIAIPSLLRARVAANESAAIGDVRTVIGAQAAYQGANAGYFDTLQCLASASACIPGYSGPGLLDAELAALGEKRGYRRTFHAGRAPSTPLPPTASRSSITSFAYVAVPTEGGRTGIRSFCGDATGRICYERDGSTPAVVDGSCPADCDDLR